MFIQYTIESKLDLTDKFILDNIHNNITSKEYISLFNNRVLENKYSHNLLELFCKFPELIPERCDAYEPIREKFDVENLNKPLDWICQPGSAVYLKRNKKIKYTCAIENRRFMPIWDGKGKFMIPKVDLPLYLSEVKFIYDDKNVKENENFIIDSFLKKICKALETNIISKEVLEDIY